MARFAMHTRFARRGIMSDDIIPQAPDLLPVSPPINIPGSLDYTTPAKSPQSIFHSLSLFALHNNILFLHIMQYIFIFLQNGKENS
jgi:hypothetical protein